MSIQRIKIDQQLASIGLNITPAGLNIRRPRGNIQIQNRPTQLNIEQQMPTFRVNRRKLSGEMGLKSHLEFAKDFRDKGRQAGIQAVGQAKSDGNFLANHKVQGDNVSILATNKAMSRLGRKDFNIGLMPQSIPELDWDKGYINISWEKHDLQIDYNGDLWPDVSVDPPHSVEVYLRDRPYFSVTVVEAGNGTPLYA